MITLPAIEKADADAARTVAQNAWGACRQRLLCEVKHLAATSTPLLVGSDSNVKIYQVLAEDGPKLIGEHCVEDLSRIVASKLIGQHGQFLLEGCSRSELIDVSNPERVMILASYYDVPELGLVTRHRDLLMRRIGVRCSYGFMLLEQQP
jgi:hypothetical protein